MDDFIRLVGPNQAVEIFGIKLVGVTAETGRKLLFTLAFIALVLLASRGARLLTGGLLRGHHNTRVKFWTRQIIHLAAATVLLFGMVSIWFDDPTRLTTALGLVSAGLAFALQRLITAVAGYFIILRGKTFNVGDRIMMGGVRGDVIALSFTQTTIMEMGQPPQAEEGWGAWVQSRQYTGRIVTVTNAKIFDEPVYNYTRDFPYLWEELRVPIGFDADLDEAERVLLQAAGKHSVSQSELTHEAIDEMKRRYFLAAAEVKPRVYFLLTDNWVEMTVRFVVRDHGIRDVKDAMSRDVLKGLREAGIGIASTTFEIVGLPPLRIQAASNGPGSDSVLEQIRKPK